jgi:hypothetical protein
MNIRSSFLAAFVLHTLLKPRPSGAPSLVEKKKTFFAEPRDGAAGGRAVC